MSKEPETTKRILDTTTPQSHESSFLDSYMPVQCALHGTSLCLHPECTGYSDRLCDIWVNHSGK